MGLIKPVVAYVVGRGVNAGSIASPYNVLKRAFLEEARHVLNEFIEEVERRDKLPGTPGQFVMSRAYSGERVVFEADRDHRPVLDGLIDRCTIIATEPMDVDFHPELSRVGA